MVPTSQCEDAGLFDFGIDRSEIIAQVYLAGLDAVLASGQLSATWLGSLKPAILDVKLISLHLLYDTLQQYELCVSTVQSPGLLSFQMESNPKD